MALRKTKNVTNRTRQRPTRETDLRGVFSYRASRSSSDAQTGRQENTGAGGQRWWHLLPVYVAAAAITVSVLYCLSLTPTPKLTSTADSPLARDKAIYTATAEDILRSNIRYRTKLTIDTQAVARELQAAFPELSEVRISLPLIGRRPIITITAAQPAFVLASPNHPAYIITEAGVAIIRAEDAGRVDVSALPTIIDQSGLAVELGQGVIPAPDVAYIQTVTSQLGAQQLTIESLTLPAKASELHVRIKDKPYIIKFSLQTDARQAVGTYLAVREKLEAERITPTEYIDVRVEEKAYYK